MSSTTRKTFLKTAGLGIVVGATSSSAWFKSRTSKKPNIIYILADDLGYSELGCYGQARIKTPFIDSIATEGMKFTDHYSGHAVCAPSRCVLMTGLHTGHSFVRGNFGMPYAGQLAIPKDTVTIHRLLKKAGYTTGVFGKWGLGGPGSTGVPWKQGVDHFFGYLDQWRAHNYYPTFLYRNDKRVKLNNRYFSAHQRLKTVPKDPNYEKNYLGKDYSPDIINKEALEFIEKNKSKPFAMWITTTIPHVALQVPEKALKKYRGTFTETPYLGEKGYLPHPTPRAAYAAMVSRMDTHVGAVLKKLKELGLDDNTIVMFASDNGPTFNGGSDSKFFHSAGPLRGLKCSLWEGGIKIPFIARWKNHIPAGTKTNFVSGFWDIMPTLLELTGNEKLIPKNIDGISLVPTLLQKGKQKQHEYLYWESHHGRGGTKAVRMGKWKALGIVDQKQNFKRFMLFDLSNDIGETKDISIEYPDVVAKIKKIMTEGRSQSDYFNFGGPASKRGEWAKYLRKARTRLEKECK